MHNGYHPPDLSLLLGQLLERSTMTIARLDRIDARLETGDSRMDLMCERLSALESRPVNPPPPQPQADPVPQPTPSPTAAADALAAVVERWVKLVLMIALPLGALFQTGSLDAALKVLSAVR